MTERKPILGRQVCATTDVGRMRSHNEDTYLVRPHVGLYLVADGMGGHQAGDVASAMVRLSVANFFDATRDKPWSDAYTAPEDAELPEPARRLAASIRKANADVYSVSQGRHFGMGSTVVAIHWPLDSETMYIGHVGDSRAYRLREGELTQLTRDHSLINEALAMDPELTEEDLARLPTNIITRALGTEPGVEVDVMTTQVKPRDMYVLCSDGLSGLISDDEIVETLALVDDVHDACEVLVALANEAGGLDNVTALVLKS